jgi:hypothetical protein
MPSGTAKARGKNFAGQKKCKINPAAIAAAKIKGAGR